MTLTTSHIADEFLLIQDILAACPDFNKRFELYPQLSIMIYTNGTCRVVHRDLDWHTNLRNAARWILRRFW